MTGREFSQAVELAAELGRSTYASRSWLLAAEVAAHNASDPEMDPLAQGLIGFARTLVGDESRRRDLDVMFETIDSMLLRVIAAMPDDPPSPYERRAFGWTRARRRDGSAGR